MQEKVEKLLDKHMLKLGSSDYRSVQIPYVTNASSRCLKAFVIDILV